MLVVRYQHKVASLVSRYVPQSDVPDVAQESFIKAYRAVGSFRGDSAFYTGCTVLRSIQQRITVAQGAVRRPVMWMPEMLRILNPQGR